MPTIINKRRHPRIIYKAEVRLQLCLALTNSPSSVTKLDLLTRDISLAGISVELGSHIQPDTDVELWLTLEGHAQTAYHLHGTIAWCGEVEGGLIAGIALDLDKSDGDLWAKNFEKSPFPA